MHNLSQGVLPWQYLSDINLEYTNRALLNNLKQLAHQVKANRKMNCEDDGHANWREEELDNKISALDRSVEVKDSRERLKETVDAIGLAKESLSYFRQYQRSRFLIYLSTMWLGWIILLFIKLAGAKRAATNYVILTISDIAFAAILITVCIMHKGKISTFLR